MSLKGFHIFFITIAVLFCAGFSTWAFLGEGSQGMQIPGTITAGMGALILIYGVWFVRKKAALIIVH
jgi:hypothetical protein